MVHDLCPFPQCNSFIFFLFVFYIFKKRFWNIIVLYFIKHEIDCKSVKLFCWWKCLGKWLRFHSLTFDKCMPTRKHFKWKGNLRLFQLAKASICFVRLSVILRVLHWAVKRQVIELIRKNLTEAEKSNW